MTGRALSLALVAAAASFGCDEVCGIEYGTAERAARVEAAAPRYGQSTSELRAATGPGAYVLPLACLFAGNKCDSGVNIDVVAGETKIIDEAPCTYRPFPTRDEAEVRLLDPLPDGVHFGYEVLEDGREHFTARVDPGRCVDGRCGWIDFEIEIVWLPAWSQDPFRDTVEYTAVYIDAEPE